MNPVEKARDLLTPLQYGDKDENPVQVATEDLKVGMEDNEEELREKTKHVGRVASKASDEATGTETQQMSNEQTTNPVEKAGEILETSQDGGKDENPVQVATDDLKVGMEDNENELREKTKHVGRVASKAQE